MTIVSWFEEQQTAAKQGRPIWNGMLRQLRRGKVRGVIIHKIDRSARNLRDWADLGELIDQGIEVHFANESLDLNSRGGRLSADIQAVVASDYVRNLREETKKGLYGRLKQGFYPMRAPIGYLDNGAAKPKTIDPMKGPLVRAAFELYSTGRWNITTLVDELWRRGLRNHAGGRVTRTGLHTVLRSPFYTGVIHIRANNQTFEGNHEALITKREYDRVQDILHGRIGTRVRMHDFLFRRFVKCAQCGRSLVGEVQKGHVYYRCHTTSCPLTSIREDAIEATVQRRLLVMDLTPVERAYFTSQITEFRTRWMTEREQELHGLRAKIEQTAERLTRATDAYLDGALDRELFENRKAALISEKRALADRLKDFESDRASIPDEVQKFVELAGSANSLYRNASAEKKRRLLRIAMSNCVAARKNIDITWQIPFQHFAEREKETDGAPSKEMVRTPARTFARLLEYFISRPALDLTLDEGRPGDQPVQR